MSLVCIPIFPLPRSYTRLTSNWLSPRLSVMPAARPRVSPVSRILALFPTLRILTTVSPRLPSFSLSLSLPRTVYLFPFLPFSFSRCLLLSLSLSLFLPPAQTSRGNKRREYESTPPVSKCYETFGPVTPVSPHVHFVTTYV